MNIRQAEIKDLETVKSITNSTIYTIYPRYYPSGAVDFFLSHHNEDHILADIDSRRVYVLENEEKALGTVTIKDFEICRLFVLPLYHGKGYGRLLLEFSEQLIAGQFNKIQLDSSLPAKEIYLKRGYKEIASHHIITENGDYLCYDVMEKELL
ncbi:GNAT family N-acetyltransferase [Lacrimispora celerecrescens]|uniref:Ribosomal protein S18 acetylase RimI-like enzyme n=1 Tax=[Clostridium] celerecrescens 18A TaxID=1286362 RepID=A0A2M8Z292_9FIRM|nr:GNAT family N-acetyltransferase [Lacrimispora celerecrescens]PJJ27578.1 ribosomal protein S18 acetylase RimI-like enzyme [[Clostridium] celerecrescens 18A]